jgi:dTDP-4-dehydrorhamnose 3,5-epimerase
MNVDERGIFSRLFAQDEMLAAGIPTKAIHVNSSISKQVGTLRGIHFQYPPFAETKVVSCISGAIWDVGIDLRPNSATRFKWFGLKLTPSNGLGLIVPEGFGHAFITLEPNSIVVYVVSETYSLETESGIRYDDPKLGIDWPIKPTVLSDKDKSWLPLSSRIDELDNRFSN